MEGNPQDSQITSSQDTVRDKLHKLNDLRQNQPLHVNKMNTAETFKQKGGKDNEKQSNINKTFPWLKSFHKLCRSSIGSHSLKLLNNLMAVYIENVSRDVANSYMKPNRAGKLKKTMNETLMFFHMYYENLKKPVEQCKYLDLMSDLMAMYMDMEIKASRRGKESLKKVTSKIISSLYVLLHCSVDHILESVLKTKFFIKSFREICIPILKQVLTPSTPDINEMTYVRRVLIFKLWKRLVQGSEERKRINKIASSIMPPPRLIDMLRCGLLASVLPPIPRNKKPATMTRFLIMAKLNLRDTIKAFLKISRDPKRNDLASAFDKSRFFSGCQIDEETPTKKDTENRSTHYMDTIWTSVSNPQSEPTKCTPISTLPSTKKKENILTVKEDKKNNKKCSKKKKGKCKKKKNKKIKAKTKDKKKSTKKMKNTNKEVFSIEFEEMLNKMKLETTNAKNALKINEENYDDSCVKQLEGNSEDILNFKTISVPAEGSISIVSIPKHLADKSVNEETIPINNNKREQGGTSFHNDKTVISQNIRLGTTGEEKDNVIKCVCDNNSEELNRLKNTTNANSPNILNESMNKTIDYIINNDNCKSIDELCSKTEISSTKETETLQSNIKEHNMIVSDSSKITGIIENKIQNDSKVDNTLIVKELFDLRLDTECSMEMKGLTNKLEDCDVLDNIPATEIHKLDNKMTGCSKINGDACLVKDTFESELKYCTKLEGESSLVNAKVESKIEDCSVIYDTSVIMDKLSKKNKESVVLQNNLCSVVSDELGSTAENNTSNACAVIMNKLESAMGACYIKKNEGSEIVEHLENKTRNSDVINHDGSVYIIDKFRNRKTDIEVLKTPFEVEKAKGTNVSTLKPIELNCNDSQVPVQILKKCQTIVVEAESSSNNFLESKDDTCKQNSLIENESHHAVVGINNNVIFAEELNGKDNIMGSTFELGRNFHSQSVFCNRLHQENSAEYFSGKCKSNVQAILNQNYPVTKFGNDILFNNIVEKENIVGSSEIIADCTRVNNNSKRDNNAPIHDVPIEQFQNLKGNVENNPQNKITECKPSFKVSLPLSNEKNKSTELVGCVKSELQVKLPGKTALVSILDKNRTKSDHTPEKHSNSVDEKQLVNANCKLGKKDSKFLCVKHENKNKSNESKRKLSMKVDLNKTSGKKELETETILTTKQKSNKNKSNHLSSDDCRSSFVAQNSSLTNKNGSKNIDYCVKNVEYICTKEPNTPSESLRMKIQRCTVKDTNTMFKNSPDTIKIKSDAQSRTKNNHTSFSELTKQDNSIRIDDQKQDSITPKNITTLSKRNDHSEKSLKFETSQDYVDISRKVFVQSGKKNGVTKLVQLPMKNAVYINIKNDEKLCKEVQIKVHKLNDNTSKDNHKIENIGVPESKQTTVTSKKLSSLVNSVDLCASSVGSLLKKRRSSCKEKSLLIKKDSKFRKLNINFNNDEVNSKVQNVLQLNSLNGESVVKNVCENIPDSINFEVGPKLETATKVINTSFLDSYEVKSELENVSITNNSKVNFSAHKPVENISQMNILKNKAKFAKPINHIQQVNSHEENSKIINPPENYIQINIPQVRSKIDKSKTEKQSQNILKVNNFETKSKEPNIENIYEAKKSADLKTANNWPNKTREDRHDLHSEFENPSKTFRVNCPTSLNPAQREYDVNTNGVNLAVNDSYLLSDQVSVPKSYLNMEKSCKEYAAALTNQIFSTELYLPSKMNCSKVVSLNTRDHGLQNKEPSTQNTISSHIECGYGQAQEINLSTKGLHTSRTFNLSPKDDHLTNKDLSLLGNKLYSQPESLLALNGSIEFCKSNSTNDCGLNAFTPQLRQFVSKENLVYRMPDVDSVVSIPTESTFNSNTSLTVDLPYVTSNTADTYSEQHSSIQLSPQSDVLLPDSSALCLVVDKSPHKDDDFEMNMFPVAQEIEVCSAPDGFVNSWAYSPLPEGQDRECNEEWCNRNGLEENILIEKYPPGMFAPTPDNDVYYNSPSPKTIEKHLKRKHEFERILNELSKVEQISTDIVFRDSLDTEKLNIHLRTVDSDFNLCSSQHKFKDYYLSHQDIPPSVPVPYPPQVPSDNFRTLARCSCPHCCDNRCILVRNYNKLTQYRNAKIKLDIDPRSCLDDSALVDKDHNVELDCSLPLKKRKTLTQLPKLEEQEIPSYPNTPMISIAELELTNFKPTTRVIVPNPQTQVLQNTSEIPLQSKYNPDRPGWRFKTPAQLKEHPAPASDVALAAHNLINFAQCTLRKYMDEESSHSRRKQSKRHKQNMRRPNDLCRFKG